MNLIELTISKIEEIIRLADNLAAEDAQDDVEKPGDASMDHMHHLERQHLATAIDQFSPTTKCELMAFMWLGQGSIGDDLGRWDELVEAAQRQLENDIPEQLASQPNLQESLRQGLEMIGQVQSHMS
jgi:hypothetical protein